MPATAGSRRRTCHSAAPWSPPVSGEEAVAAFDRALALQPDDAEALSALADLAIERGDLTAARRQLERLRARDPGDDGVNVKLGTVLARSGDLPAAIALLQAVVARAPANVDALVNLAAAAREEW